MEGAFLLTALRMALSTFPEPRGGFLLIGVSPRCVAAQFTDFHRFHFEPPPPRTSPDKTDTNPNNSPKMPNAWTVLEPRPSPVSVGPPTPPPPPPPGGLVALFLCANYYLVLCRILQQWPALPSGPPEPECRCFGGGEWRMSNAYLCTSPQGRTGRFPFVKHSPSTQC